MKAIHIRDSMWSIDHEDEGATEPALFCVPATVTTESQVVDAYLLALEQMNSPVPPAPSLDDYKAAFDAHLDAVAQQRQYDNRLTIATYVASSNPLWAAEAQAFVAWRDQALASMFSQLAVVESGGEVPTTAAFIAALPVISWPPA